MRQINLRMSDALIEKVDRVRGNVPRQRFIRAAVKRVCALVDGDPRFDPQEFVREGEGIDGETRRRALEAVDRHRGDVPRWTFIHRTLAALDDDDKRCK